MEDEQIEEYTVGEVSKNLGVSIRTLRYWEERGLLTPVARSWANYRLYTRRDVERIQRIMIYRAVGMSLDTIIQLLNDASHAAQLLRDQRELLIEKQNELQRMIEAVNELIGLAVDNAPLTPEKIGEILGEPNFSDYHEEAVHTWGETEDWEISQQNWTDMTKEDWEGVKEETQEMENKLAQAFVKGIQPGSDEAHELIEQHRALLSRFFPVTHEKHVLIARGYTADPRFQQHYDKRAEGLALWLQQSIDANALKQGYDPDTAQWR